MKNLFNRIKRLWQLSKEYDDDKYIYETRHKSITYHLDNIQKRLNEHTTVHADVHYKEPHQIIVIGRYKNKDYVRVFNLKTKNFEELIKYLQEEEKYAKVGKFDMPNRIAISTVYDKERFE